VKDNILELKAHFESKLNLIQWLYEKIWIKSMCIKYITYIFSIAIRLHVCGSKTHYQTKGKWKNNIVPTYKIFSFFYGNGLFLKLRVYYAFTIHEVQKNTFFEWIFNQNF
jgi:hypothetical protein